MTEILGFSLLDVALGILFGIGITIFGWALYQESKEKAPVYTILITAGAMIAFIATFVAAMKR